MAGEIPLTGGNLSGAVRVGDTVRRRAGPWTPTIQLALRHLEARGFAGAPRAIGSDEQGREVVSWVEGWSPGWPERWPDYVWSERALVAAARLLRAYHDAVADVRLPRDAAFRLPATPGADTICHNDVAPFNSVFREGIPIAMIDWDLAAPGRRIADVAVGVWRWAPLNARLHPDVRVDPLPRVRAFCDAYGLAPSERADLLEALTHHVRWLGSTITRLAREGDAGFQRLVEMSAPEFLSEDLEAIDARRDELRDVLR